ncbi:MAG: DUF167 domain-containing protein [Deltaproteobacteria bacterium]|nr:DUF167 domain-containing protein [Deltaproteobacteria bacterium]
MLFLQEKPQGIFFKVFVQPKSSKNMITGIYGDAIKIKLTAPPIDGAANKMCIKFLAKCFKIPKTTPAGLSTCFISKNIIIKTDGKTLSVSRRCLNSY